MIKILIGKWFNLPRVGPDVFSKLIRQARLGYDRQKRMFLVGPDTNIALLISILNEVLEDKVLIELPCLVCEKSAGCNECDYLNICDRTTISNQCICMECFMQKDAYEHYCDTFSQKLIAAKVKI